MVVVEKENGEEVMLAIGGYNGDRFLDSVEKYDPTGMGSWELVPTMRLNESRSHFCAVFYKVTKINFKSIQFAIIVLCIN